MVWEKVHTADTENTELQTERERERLSGNIQTGGRKERRSSSSSRKKSQEEEMPKDKVVTLV